MDSIVQYTEDLTNLESLNNTWMDLDLSVFLNPFFLVGVEWLLGGV